MLLAVLGYGSFTQEQMYWDMWVTLLESGLFSQGTLWNLGSRDQAGLELGWPRLALRAYAGTRQTLNFLLSAKVKAAVSPAPVPGQSTLSLPPGPWRSHSSNFWRLCHCTWDF